MQNNTLGDRVGRLISTVPGSTVVGDTLSIKVFQAVVAGLALVPDRKVILSDNGNFPTELYMVEGLMKLKDRGYVLRIPDLEDAMGNITEEVGVVMITEVDYRTGRKHDMEAIIEKAHSLGALVVWDLAHSAGAFPVDVCGLDTNFAVGCTHKYFNGRPGAPAFKQSGHWCARSESLLRPRPTSSRAMQRTALLPKSATRGQRREGV